MSLPYPDETVALDALIATARGESKSDVAAAGAGDCIDAIATANNAFKAVYDELTAQRKVDWKELRAADAEAQESFLVLLCHVVDVAHGTPALAALLDPVEVQQQAMRALFQSRRGVVDIDPETGGDLPEPVATDATTPDAPA